MGAVLLHRRQDVPGPDPAALPDRPGAVHPVEAPGVRAAGGLPPSRRHHSHRHRMGVRGCDAGRPRPRYPGRAGVSQGRPRAAGRRAGRAGARAVRGAQDLLVPLVPFRNRPVHRRLSKLRDCGPPGGPGRGPHPTVAGPAQGGRPGRHLVHRRAGFAVPRSAALRCRARRGVLRPPPGGGACAGTAGGRRRARHAVPAGAGRQRLRQVLAGAGRPRPPADAARRRRGRGRLAHLRHAAWGGRHAAPCPCPGAVCPRRPAGAGRRGLPGAPGLCRAARRRAGRRGAGGAAGLGPRLRRRGGAGGLRPPGRGAAAAGRGPVRGRADTGRGGRLRSGPGVAGRRRLLGGGDVAERPVRPVPARAGVGGAAGRRRADRRAPARPGRSAGDRGRFRCRRGAALRHAPGRDRAGRGVGGRRRRTRRPATATTGAGCAVRGARPRHWHPDLRRL